MNKTLITNNITGSRGIVAEIKDMSDFNEVVNFVLNNNDEVVSIIARAATLENLLQPFISNIDFKMKDGGTGVCNGIPYIVDESMCINLINFNLNKRL